jgi:hypothetical protein
LRGSFLRSRGAADAQVVSALRKTAQCLLVPCSVRLSLGRSRRILKSQALGRRAGGFQRCRVVVAGGVSLKSNAALTRRLELGTGRVGGFEHRRVVVAGGAFCRSKAVVGRKLEFGEGRACGFALVLHRR